MEKRNQCVRDFEHVIGIMTKEDHKSVIKLKD
jgi:hypothetical protein